MRRQLQPDWDATLGWIRGSTPELQTAARQLRRRMTPAEQVVWQELRGQKLAGLRFRRQHTFGPFILDFACPERLLAVELDGRVHVGREEEDAARTTTLETFGWCVIRFANELVFAELPSVLRAIERAALSRPIARGWNTGRVLRENK